MQPAMHAYTIDLNFNNTQTSIMESELKEDLDDGISHGILVSNLVVMLCRELKMPEVFCYDMAQAGVLHDIGKMRLSSYLYGRHKNLLLIEEVKYMRMHPQLSYNILQEKGYPNTVLESVLNHHENYDGSGYPNNLIGQQIPLGARILRICDVFIALTSNRKYRSAFDLNTAIELMIDQVKDFDMQIFLSFQRVINSKEFSEKFKQIS